MDPSAVDSLSPLRAGKRAAILEGARAVFLREGFGGSNMDEVAQAAGVGKQTVYRHFGTKEALFESLLGEMCAGLFQPLAPEGRSLRDALRAIGESHVRTMTAPANLALLRIVVAEAERFPGLARRFHAAGATAPTTYVAAILLRETGISDSRAEELAATFLEMVKGPAFLRLLLGAAPSSWNESFERQIGEAVAYVSGQLPARSPAAR
ncbi:TetR/AcrR family transcriptional regulator [Labrys monachus]|uniref:AcrR family transcriptional regulator n=1 Tax=Labrys monachus TaxID=217067 RepID=A0ABU0FF29_9HYPH|nr:TetR/AcrR family transcriptional regulator [Labrys monachus]MDQ0393217.1 AcrR family transcriptional regulator [Labrys monachus]